MGGLAAAGDGSTATGSTQAFSTMGLKPEPLVQTVPDLDDNDVATVDNAISMLVRQPWDELGDFGSSTTSAYPIKAVRIDPLGSSHTHTMFDMSIGDTGSTSSSNNSSFSNVPSYRSNVPSYRRSAEDPYAMLGHGNVLSGTEDDSEEDGEDDSDGGHADAGMGGMDMGEDEGIASYRNSAAASAAQKRQTADGPSASSSSSSSSKAAAAQRKQLAKQQKTAAAVAAAKARTGPPPAIPTSRDIAAFDPTKVVAIGGGPADAALTAHAHNDTTRPPYSYTAIIYRAVDALGKKRVQLGEIYYQIMLSWAYYAARPLETGWKNSIRHNLTVCRCFKKVARAEGESGKGGYWTIDEPFAKIDIQLDPRDASPRLSKKKIKKKSKSRTLADRKEKPLTFSPSSPQISRRSVPSPQMLEAAAVATAAVAATEALSASSSSSLSSSGNEAIFAAPVPTRQGTRSQRTRATRTSTAAAAAAAAATAAAAAAAAVTATATPETVYPTHLLAHTFEEDATDFSPREHDDAGNPLPAIPRGPGHTTRVVLPASELDESFSALAGMSLNLSSSFGNAMLGNSLGGSNVLNASFSNLLAGGQLVD